MQVRPQDTWQAMEKLVDDGLVKAIGISNFSCRKTDDLLSYARIQPAAIQVEVHPYFRNQKLLDHAKSKVQVAACFTELAVRCQSKVYSCTSRSALQTAEVLEGM